MRAHYLQHVPFEGPGSIEAWFASAGYAVTSTKLYESADLPDAGDIDFLVIMGGPMSVNDETQYPWLADEKIFIRTVIESGIPTLGICLGAQLIASALGSTVFKNPAREIGWFPVQGLSLPDSSVFRFPDELTVFHWHGETFDLPPGAARTAESKGCMNQAFQIGTYVIGLQFHLETTPESAESIVSHCRNELVNGEYIQTEKEILSAPASRYAAVNAVMNDILEYLQGSRKA